MSKWQPVDFVVMAITVTISALVMAVIASRFVALEPMEDAAGERFAGMLGGLISIISLYVGSQLQKHANGDSTKV